MLEALDDRIVQNADPVAADLSLTTHSASLIFTPPATDPDDDPLTFVVGMPQHGSVAYSGVGNSFVYTPPVNPVGSSAGFVGIDAFPFTVDDGQGGTATGTIRVEITNAAPTVTNYDVYVHAGAVVVLDLAAGIGDPDGDPVFLGALHSDDGTVSWDNTILSQAGFTPFVAAAGVVTFTYTAYDNDLVGSVGTVYVHYLNDPPTANVLSLAAHAGSTVLVQPGLFGSDPDGDPLTVTNVGTTYHGSAAYDPLVGISYVPEFGFTGQESFPFTLSDGLGGTAIGMITVAYSNTDPDAQDFGFSTNRGTPISGNLLAGASDPDGDTLTAQVASGPYHGVFTLLPDGTFTYDPAGYAGREWIQFAVLDGVGGATVKTLGVRVRNGLPVLPGDVATGTGEDTTLVLSFPPPDESALWASTPPQHGTLAIDGLDVTYTPDPDWNGTDTFTLRTFDGYSDYASATITVTPVNDAPRTTENTVAEIDEDTTATFALADLLAKFTDIEGDPIVFAGLEDPEHGTVSIDGNGQITYTPALNWGGTDSFFVKVANSNPASDDATWFYRVYVVVASVNDAPTVIGDSVSTCDGLPCDILVTANDSDVEGNFLFIVDFTQPTHGSVTSDGTGMRYTPDAGYFGTDGFTYSVSDGHGGTASANVVVNREVYAHGPLRVWSDDNGNGLMGLYEPGIYGVVVELYDQTDGVLLTTQTTNPDGEFAFNPPTVEFGHDYQFRVYNPDPSRLEFTTQSMAHYGSKAGSDGWLSVFQSSGPKSGPPSQFVGVAEKPKVLITVDDDIKQYTPVNPDGSHGDPANPIPNKKGLNVAKWKDAFESEPRFGDPPGRIPLVTDRIEVIPKDLANERDFIDGDPDRFRVRVFNLEKWNLTDGAGKPAFPVTAIRIGTKDGGAATYRDNSTPVAAARDPNRPGWFVSDTQLLVSNDVDDREYGQNIGEDDLAYTGNAGTAYDKDGLLFTARSDRTHIVRLGGTVEAKYVFGGNTPDLVTTTIVPIKAQVKVHVNVLTKPAELGGGTVLGPNAAAAVAEALKQLEIANEVFAQVGIKLVFAANVVQVVDPPADVTLKDFIDPYNVPQDGDFPGKIVMSPELRALVGANRTPADDDIEIYFVNRFVEDIKGRETYGLSFSESGLRPAPAANTPGDQIYRDSVVIAAELLGDARFVLAHEIAHILINDGGMHRFGPRLKAYLAQTYLLAEDQRQEGDTVLAHKRLFPDEQGRMLEGASRRQNLLLPP